MSVVVIEFLDNVVVIEFLENVVVIEFIDNLRGSHYHSLCFSYYNEVQVNIDLLYLLTIIISPFCDLSSFI